MSDIHAEYRAFTARKLSEVADARQTAALQLACGIDLTEAMAAGPDLKAGLVRRLTRAIERERLRGMRRHWSYDLNRHIALKQALDRLCGRSEKRKAGPRTTSRRCSFRIATK
ncbi:cytoplasmic protein [Mesorhizobium sp. KR1-2]|uniref:cytoplasmic protein n=1 Tax=Mesorhizobium sp. KR1-2 TaxID=3156609 RepID=UPI0032B56C7A